MSDVQPKPGLLARLGRLTDTSLAILQTRLALLSVEVQDEALRLGSLMFSLIAAALFTGFGILAIAIFATLVFWDSYRLWAVGIASLLFIILAGASWWLALRALSQPRRLFSDSLAQLQKDRDLLKEVK